MIPADFKPTIHRLETAESTNATAREMARKGAPEGSVFIAERQTRGRGRGTRTWHSPKGGLYLSVLLYPKEARRATDLPILAGVALAQSVKELLPKSSDVSVKWPNDCLIGWKKVGGVLCESLGEAAFNLCVVGIGLNVNLDAKELDAFQGLPFGATSFKMATGGEYSLDQVTDIFLKKLFNLYHLYHSDGFTPIQFLWEKNCALVGKKIEFRDHDYNDSASQDRRAGITVGTFLGIDENGAIVVSNAKGERHTYVSGEISCFWP